MTERSAIRNLREPRSVTRGRNVHLNVLLLANRNLDKFEAICRTSI